MFEKKEQQELIQAICALAEEVHLVHTAISSSLEWFKSYSNLATKQDLKELTKIIMDGNEQIQAALDKIDVATNKIATNVQSNANVIQTISNELDTLVAKLMTSTGVDPALVQKAQNLADRAQTASDALDAQVPVLQAIAAKGVSNPVPINPTATPTS